MKIGRVQPRKSTEIGACSSYLFLAAISLMAFLISADGHSAEVQDASSGLKIELGENWREIPKNVPVKFMLGCTNPKCGDKTRSFINTNFDRQLQQARTEKFLSMVPANQFPSMVRQMLRRMGKVERTIEVKPSTIGGKRGYIGKFYIRYVDGRERYLVYAMTFDRGWFYHFQIFGEKGFEAAVDEYGQELLSGVSILR